MGRMPGTRRNDRNWLTSQFSCAARSRADPALRRAFPEDRGSYGPRARCGLTSGSAWQAIRSRDLERLAARCAAAGNRRQYAERVRLAAECAEEGGVVEDGARHPCIGFRRGEASVARECAAAASEGRGERREEQEATRMQDRHVREDHEYGTSASTGYGACPARAASRRCAPQESASPW